MKLFMHMKAFAKGIKEEGEKLNKDKLLVT